MTSLRTSTSCSVSQPPALPKRALSGHEPVGPRGGRAERGARHAERLEEVAVQQVAHRDAVAAEAPEDLAHERVVERGGVVHRAARLAHRLELVDRLEREVLAAELLVGDRGGGEGQARAMRQQVPDGDAVLARAAEAIGAGELGEHVDDAGRGGQLAAADRAQDERVRERLREREDAEDVVGARLAAGVALGPADRLVQRHLAVAAEHDDGPVVQARLDVAFDRGTQPVEGLGVQSRRSRAQSRALLRRLA